jgi:sorbitol/mannitol transport system substrate-binding protein
MTLKAIDSADTGLNGNSKPKPYIGIQYAAIPEFQGIATAVGQQFSAALVGQVSATQALDSAQRLTEREMTRAGYIK